MPKSKKEWEEVWNKSNTFVVEEEKDNNEFIPDLENFNEENIKEVGQNKPISKEMDDYYKAFALLKEYSGYKQDFFAKNIFSAKKSHAKEVRQILGNLDKKGTSKTVITIFDELYKKFGIDPLEKEKGDLNKIIEVIQEKNSSKYNYKDSGSRIEYNK
jgi:hypothetical protein